ncbi:MAG: crotonase/enoyl-CoA hydratase family protein [Actinobacteria bacterium]|nr:crotonase/enoyl-CoA hydratase family protein [Actinomycetota bacterium]
MSHIETQVEQHVATLWLNRPDKLNALAPDMWEEIPAAVAALDADPEVRVIVVAGRGRAFTVGIDLEMLASLRPPEGSVAGQAEVLYAEIRRLQGTVNCLASTDKPVIAAIHGYCLGAGVNLISACDLRIAAADAVFSIRETRMGLVADIGALQRLPLLIGEAVVAEMAYTGGDFDARWALEKGLVSRVVDDVEKLHATAAGLASEIASNSPLVTRGIKTVLRAGRGRTLEEGLEYVARWNSTHLLSDDLVEAMTAFLEKRPARFTGT